MNRVLIQIDGSNFYNKIKKVSPQIHLTNFKYNKLVYLLTHSTNTKIIYYVGEVKKYPNNEKSQQLYSS